MVGSTSHSSRRGMRRVSYVDPSSRCSLGCCWARHPCGCEGEDAMRRLVAALSVLLIVAASAIADDAAAHAGGGHVILRSGARAPTTPAAVDTKKMVAIITAAARRYGQSPAAMLAVARCESGLNPRDRKSVV